MPEDVECKNCDYFKYKKYTNRHGFNWTCSDCLQAYWEKQREKTK